MKTSHQIKGLKKLAKLVRHRSLGPSKKVKMKVTEKKKRTLIQQTEVVVCVKYHKIER